MLRDQEILTTDDDGSSVGEPPHWGPEQEVVLTTSQIAGAVVGVVLLAFGIVVIFRAGLDRPLEEPQVVVAGLTHTATIALVELGLGLALLLCALNPGGRILSGLIGMTMLAGGLIFLAEPSGLLADLRTESDLGWLGVVGGGALLLALLATAVRTRAPKAAGGDSVSAADDRGRQGRQRASST